MLCLLPEEHKGPGYRSCLMDVICHVWVIWAGLAEKTHSLQKEPCVLFTPPRRVTYNPFAPESRFAGPVRCFRVWRCISLIFRSLRCVFRSKVRGLCCEPLT